MSKNWWIASVVVLIVVLGFLGFRAVKNGPDRPPGPPEGVSVSLPFGAVDIDAVATGEVVSEIEQSLVESIEGEAPGAFDPDGDGVRSYQVLAISGGGSNGAFGSGFINGWTAAGTRPDFKVVTGVSTGSLQAVLAFLGPEYDPVLEEVYLLYTGDQIAVRRSPLAALFNDSTWDLSPLAETIRSYMTDELLAKVAAKHKAGHRLYVGTTNMDTAEFVIWDMGEIAASDRPDKREHFAKVLLASCSVPVLFSPVYFEVEGDDGNTYYEMHSDGSTFAQVFFRGFLMELQDFIELIEQTGGVEVELYIVRNGKLEDLEKRSNLKPSVPAIAGRSIESLFKITLRGSVYRMYVLAMRYGVDFNLAAIPNEDEPDLDPLLFEEQGMKRLYDLGYRLASEGYDWIKVPPKLDPGEIIAGPSG